ncbi:MAG: hypothetical protein ACJASN_000724 [Cyclobacteriaceae bacterium]|jgi:hypothetical protein
MKQQIIFAVVGYVLVACGGAAPYTAKPTDFYPLDSLMSAQQPLLQEKEVVKTVSIGEKSENTTFEGTEDWFDKEFGFLKEFELNKPGYVGSIEVSEKEGVLLYAPKAGEKMIIDFVKYTFDENRVLATIEGTYTDQNAKSIYGSFRSFTLDFSQGVLQSYKIRGYQKIILRDTVYFEVSGIIN